MCYILSCLKQCLISIEFLTYKFIPIQNSSCIAEPA